ncbi:MAG: IclR family transcriptional regulator [Candidatus Caldatribacteriota bacterium]
MKGKTVNSIDRTLQILQLFSLQKPEWGVSEISRALNLYKSYVHNILFTLLKRGFVTKNPANDKYRLSIKFFELGSIVLENIDLRKIAHPYMEQLSQEFNETVHLGILSEGEVVSIEQEKSNQTLQPQIYIGKRAPLHCTGVGKALLAFLPAEEIDRIIQEKGLKKYTDNTITNTLDLKKELEKIRQFGYALDNMEHEPGVRCIAAPIRDHRGNIVASMSLSGPAFRIGEDQITLIKERVIYYTRLISQAMGYRDTEKDKG